MHSLHLGDTLFKLIYGHISYLSFTCFTIYLTNTGKTKSINMNDKYLVLYSAISKPLHISEP